MERTGSASRVAVWVLSALLAVVFLAAGVPKLVGASPLLLQAAAMRGFPTWVRILVGLIETGGAILLLVPSAATWAALALALLMVPATFTQRMSGEPGAWVPAVLFVLLPVLAWVRRPAALRDGHPAFLRE